MVGGFNKPDSSQVFSVAAFFFYKIAQTRGYRLAEKIESTGNFHCLKMGWVDFGFCKIWCQLQIKMLLKQHEVLDRLEADSTASKVVRWLDDTTPSGNNISFPLTSDAFKFFMR